MVIEGLSGLASTLVYAIGVALVGAAGLITWLVKFVVPRLLTGFEKRNDALILATEKTAEAVGQIPVAFKSFELALTGTEARITASVDGSKDAVLKSIVDKRFDELAALVRGKAATAAEP